MFKLRFPSGAVVQMNNGSLSYDGTLYIWAEDLEPLLDMVHKEYVIHVKDSESNDAQDNRTEYNRD